VAVNCWVSPAATEAAEGATEIDVNTAGVTVSGAEPLIVPDFAVMVTVPEVRLVATPLLLTVAIDVAEELHVALLVRFCVVPLLYVPVALYCCVKPAAMDAEVGVTAIELSTAVVTVNVVEPLTVPDLAVIVAVPTATAVASPVVLFTVATEVFEEVQVELVVKFCLVPLLYVPVAVNC
jgi:hypothetical protein